MYTQKLKRQNFVCSTWHTNQTESSFEFTKYSFLSFFFTHTKLTGEVTVPPLNNNSKVTMKKK